MNAVVQSLPLSVRPMRRADVVQIDQIEQLAYPFPWSIGIFRDCLQAGYLCRVLDSSVGLAGYAVLSVAANEAHILNFCISPDRRRQRLGTVFLERLIDEIQQLDVDRIILEVRPSNLAAQNLYRQAGFSQVGLRRGYYPADNGREDALVLVRELGRPVSGTDTESR